jgi:hypothetical protein
MLAVVLLLASIGTASAECAWVMWGQQFTRTDVIQVAEGGYNSREGCISAVQVRVADGGADELKKKRIRFACLPDTIDPRGPKRR